MPHLDFTMPEGATFEWLVQKPAMIILIIVIGFIARWLTHRLINRIVKKSKAGPMPNVITRGRSGSKPPGDDRPGAGARREQRAGAMGSLLRSLATGVIFAIVVLEALDQVGLNLAPLIASAGIVGVALGFGAQTLVQDFISGVFMIIEDQYGVGDWVDLGEANGAIEAVGLRVTRLRDLNGTVWYVRNGEVVRVGNMTQNWARSVVDTTVGYESNLDRVQDLLKEVGDGLFHESTYRGIILEPPEVWGVQSLDKDGVVIRMVVKTVPMQQWGVERQLRARIKDAFDAESIRIPAFTLPFSAEGAERT